MDSKLINLKLDFVRSYCSPTDLAVNEICFLDVLTDKRRRCRNRTHVGLLPENLSSSGTMTLADERTRDFRKVIVDVPRLITSVRGQNKARINIYSTSTL